MSAPQSFLDVHRIFLSFFFVFPRDEVCLSVRYFLVMLADPDCAGGGPGRARAVPRQGLLSSFFFSRIYVYT